jgi:ligand-binding sensor domain-containing protein
LQTALPVIPAQRRYVAQYDYQSVEADGLSFKKGDIIIIVDDSNSNWWMGELNGARGWVPSNYLKLAES